MDNQIKLESIINGDIHIMYLIIIKINDSDHIFNNFIYDLIHLYDSNPYIQSLLHYYYDNITIKKNANLAYKFAKLAAMQNNSYGLNCLGRCYTNGIGIEINKDEAFKYFKLSADQNNSFGQNNLGLCYYSGIGITDSSTDFNP